MDRIDFRSDTVTWPTAEMRAAMASAVVGDDVYGEDPTVKQLEAMAAEKFGMEAGLLVSSGTMGNLVAIMSHAGRGEEAIVGEDTHSYINEAGGMAVLGSVTPRPRPTDEMGRMALADIEAAIRADDSHYPRSRLILLENSYGGRGGAAIPLDYFAAVSRLAQRHQLKIHLDGARLFNATSALGVSPASLVSHVDSVTFCLSKGLCAPVGSLLCGSSEFIGRARRVRKMLGGGMRQAGILAAAGIVALESMVERLAEDHVRAKRLALGLAQIPAIKVQPEAVMTNIVFFGIDEHFPLTAEEVARRMRESANVWVGADKAKRFRAVTHYWIDDEAVDCFLDAMREALRYYDA